MKFFKKKEEIHDPFTVEQCNSCNNSVKRKFNEGDYIFKTCDNCNSCKNGTMMISKIFGEVIKS